MRVMKPSVYRVRMVMQPSGGRMNDTRMPSVRATMWNPFTLFDISHFNCKRSLVLLISRSCLQQRKSRQYLGVTMCHCETLSAVIKETELLKVNHPLHIYGWDRSEQRISHLNWRKMSILMQKLNTLSRKTVCDIWHAISSWNLFHFSLQYDANCLFVPAFQFRFCKTCEKLTYFFMDVWMIKLKRMYKKLREHKI